MTEKILNDDVVQNFNDQDEFIERLEEVESNTTWIKRNISELLIDNAAINATDAQRHTNLMGTKLMLCPRGLIFGTDDYYPIRECAKYSMFQRLGLGGEILKHLDLMGIHQMTEMGVRYMPDKAVKIPVVEGKINAFLSDRYVDCLPATLVFDEFIKHLNSVTGETKFPFVGSWSYPTSTGWFTLPEKRTVGTDEYELVVGATTSDAGFSGIHFHAYLKNSNVFCMPLMTSLNLVHKDKTTYIELSKTLELFDAAIKKGVGHLGDLMLIKIDNPISTIKRVAQKVDLPKKETLEIIENLHSHLSTAFDCYITLSRLMNNNYSLTVKERIQGNLAKCLAIDWKSYDLPGDYAW